MSQMYELRILVPLAKVATIIEVLAGEGTLLNVSTVAGKKKHHRKSEHRYNGPVTGYELANEFIKRRKTFKAGDLVAAFVKDKRNAKSASPILTRLKVEGKVKHLADGSYERKSS